MANYASKVIEIATAEVGYLEKKSNSQLDDKTANAGSNNYTKYARDLDNISGFYNGKKNGYAWCDVFVDWCFVQAFGVTEAKKLLNHGTAGAGCIYSANYFRNASRFYTSPKVGDQIFFGTKGNETHTGLVYAVDSSKVYTIEGNTSGASGVVANGGGVCKKSYALTYSKIVGYGRPNYDAEPTTTTTTTTTSTSTSNSALSKDIDWYGTVTASSLNVRKWAGTQHDKCSFSPLAKGTKVGVCDSVKASDGTVWYYVKVGSKYGFVSGKYIKKN